MIRTRFAPSPTGYLHVGGARTALFNYLFARANQGTYILRIEDTDQERSSKESMDLMIQSMKWLGLNWDEGPDCGGDFGPYVQSERLHIYRPIIEQLLIEKKAYKCFCSQEELDAKHAKQEEKGEAQVYDGTCRNLTDSEVKAKQDAGLPFTVRLAVPWDEEILVQDLVQGDVRFHSSIMGDFIIVKSDGFPTYNFAMVIDDHLMKITHVIRGVGHLSNTPRQIAIARALGYPLPVYAHVSQIVGPDRKKLSKRHGATGLDEYERQGYLPEALVNHLALLGWSSPDGEEFIRQSKLEQGFDITRCNKSDAVFDQEKLDWLNGKYIREYSVPEIADLLKPFAEKWDDFPKEILTNDKWMQIVELMRDYFVTLQSAKNHILPLFASDTPPENDEAMAILRTDKSKELIPKLLEKLMQADKINGESFFAIMKEAGKECQVKGKDLFMSTRVAMTGALHGPDLPKLVDLLGADLLINRLQQNIARL